MCQHCQMEPPWGGSRAGWDCLDLQNVLSLGFIPGLPCWVISSTRQVWTAREGREQELQVQVQAAGILHFWPVLCALNRSGFQKELSSPSPESHLWHFLRQAKDWCLFYKANEMSTTKFAFFFHESKDSTWKRLQGKRDNHVAGGAALH